MWLILLASLLHCASTYDVDVKKLEGLARARVEMTQISFSVSAVVIRGTGVVELNRLSEVKAFVLQDIPLYHNLVMKHIPGADPELVLLNHYHEELDRIALSDMSRSQINELLVKLGFYKKSQAEDEVPEEFRFSPAKDSPVNAGPPYKPATSTPASEPDPEAMHTDL